MTSKSWVPDKHTELSQAFGGNYIKTSEQLVSSSKVLPCHCKWHRRIAHQTHTAWTVFMWSGWIEGSLLFFQPGLPKRRKQCDGVSTMLWLSAALWTRWKVHMEIEMNCLSFPVSVRPLPTSRKFWRSYRFLCLEFTRQTSVCSVEGWQRPSGNQLSTNSWLH